jgi:hypothetical protein
MIANQLVVNALSSNTFTFLFSNAYAFNTIKANAIVTDSATTNMVVNSILSSQITVNTVLGTPTITPLAANFLDGGQSFTFNAALLAGNTGTGPYTYNIWVFNSITNTMIANQLVVNALSSNTFTFLFSNAYAFNTIKANVMVTDSATTNMIANSMLSSNVVINVAPNVILTASNASIIPGQPSALTVSIPANVGIGPFMANIFSSGVYFSTLYLAGGSANTAVYASALSGSYSLNVIATDLGTSTPFVFPSSYVPLIVTPVSGGTGAIIASSGGVIGISGAAMQSGSTTTITTTTSASTTTIKQIVINSTKSTSEVIANVTPMAPIAVVLAPIQASVTLFTSSSTAVSEQVRLQNYTAQAPPAPPNYKKVIAVNILVSAAKNLTVNATLHYNCSIPSTAVAPFILNASTLNWQKISPFIVNQTACSVSFSVPMDPVVALLFAGPTNSTTVTTAVSTIPPRTTIPSTAEPGTGEGLGTLIAVIIIVALFVHLHNKGKRALKRHEPAKVQEKAHGRAPSER